MKYPLWLLACCALLGACTGAIDGAPEPGPAPTGGGKAGTAGTAGTGTTPRPGGSDGTTAPPAGPQPSARLHKLTTREFANSVRDLLGEEVPLSALEPDQESDGLAAVGARVVALSPGGVARYETVLTTATDRALADATRAAKVLACVPQNFTDPACATKAINAFGRRAFRRPLAAAETARYLGLAQAIAQEAGNPLVGMRHAVQAMLQSPSFLYRVELGTPSAPDRGRLKYTPFEMASRLAALLWSSVPDDPLLDAAAANALGTPEGIRKEAERLLGHANARRALAVYVDDLYGVEHLQNAIKDTAVFKGWTAGLRDAMREDLLRRIEDVVFGNPGDFLSLYDGRAVFVNNELAKLYGLPAQTPDGYRRAELPEDSPRRGLLGSGAVLAGYALPQRTSPTARGKFVAEVLLCKTVPLPPPGVETTLDETGMQGGTLREQLQKHRENPGCAGCHALMDPIGLGLENFDGIGAYRTTDKGKAIDPSGDLDGAPFKTAAELGTRVRQHANASSCVVDKLYAHALGRAPLAVDEPARQALAKSFEAGVRRVDRLLLDLATSESFRFVEPNAP